MMNILNVDELKNDVDLFSHEIAENNPPPKHGFIDYAA